MALQTPTLPPNHPASIQLSAWLSAFNTEDEGVLAAYRGSGLFPYHVASRDISSRAKELALARSTGGFDLALVRSASAEGVLVVVLREKRRAAYRRVEIRVASKDEKYPVTGIAINQVPIPLELVPGDHPRRREYEKAYTSLTRTLRRGIIDEISGVLRDQDVYPALGEQIVASLAKKWDKGEYKTIEDSAIFAHKLTEDIHEAGHDLHMSVAFSEPKRPVSESQGRSGDDDSLEKSPPPELFESSRDRSFGFSEISFDTASVPEKTIAVLPITVFVTFRPDLCSDGEKIRDAISGVLSQVADCDAVFIDLRQNRGGDPQTVAFILSYFLGDGTERLHLLDFVDRDDEVKESFYTTPASQLPAESARFGHLKPLFVLTSRDTISGGEDMSNNLQAFGRATIVGEHSTTAGAANPITRVRHICEEEFGGWWTAAVPNLRPVHSVTGGGWEGVGILSDHVAGQDNWEDFQDAREVAGRLAAAKIQRISRSH